MLLICGIAFAGSALTFVSGFGLGTLLTPAFALFFPVQAAIAATAIVHLVNNLFKLALVGRAADWRVVRRFGFPAAVAAIAGAGVLVATARVAPLWQYELWGGTRSITAVKLLIGGLIVAFAILEASARLQSVRIAPRHLAWGGMLTGFFGGLSGVQGALRSGVLMKAGLSRDAFIATGVVCAVIVDLVRLAVYGISQAGALFGAMPPGATTAVVAATASACAGAFLGSRFLRRLTLRTVQQVVATMLVAIGLALCAGLI